MSHQEQVEAASSPIDISIDEQAEEANQSQYSNVSEPIDREPSEERQESRNSRPPSALNASKNSNEIVREEDQQQRRSY